MGEGAPSCAAGVADGMGSSSAGVKIQDEGGGAGRRVRRCLRAAQVTAVEQVFSSRLPVIRLRRFAVGGGSAHRTHDVMADRRV